MQGECSEAVPALPATDTHSVAAETFSIDQLLSCRPVRSQLNVGVPQSASKEEKCTGIVEEQPGGLPDSKEICRVPAV
jgi:hypothetical protein